ATTGAGRHHSLTRGVPCTDQSGAPAMANPERNDSSQSPTGDRLTLKITVLPAREYHVAGCDAPGCMDAIEFRIDGAGVTRPYRTCRRHIAVAARYLIRQQFGDQLDVDLAALPRLPTPELTALRTRLAEFVGGEWSPALQQLRQAVDEELSRRDSQSSS